MKGTDPSVKLLKLAKAHPELLREADTGRVLRSLILNGKPQSLKLLIEKAGYEPVLSDELEAELITCLRSDGGSDAMLAALKILSPKLAASQRKRLAIGKNAPPPKPIEKSGKKASKAENAQAKPLRYQWLHALQDGDDALLDQLLKEDADSKVSHADRWAGLRFAVAHGRLDLVKNLLERDAIRAGLGERGPQLSESILHVALHYLPDIEEGTETESRHGPAWEIFKALLAWPLAREAACKPDVFFDVPNKNVLQAAIQNKDVQALKELLKYPEFRASIKTSRFEGRNVLHMAVDKGAVGSVDALMALPETRALHVADRNKVLPLEAAFHQSGPQMARALLKDRRAYRDFDAKNRPSIVALAAAHNVWDLLPELLAVPAFAASAGGVDAQGSTALMHAVRARNLQAIGKLLAMSEIRDTIFTACKFGYADSPANASATAASTAITMDAVGLAIWFENPEALHLLLALPKVQARLRDDPEWKKDLLKLASDNNATEIINRLNSF